MKFEYIVNTGLVMSKMRTFKWFEKNFNLNLLISPHLI